MASVVGDVNTLEIVVGNGVLVGVYSKMERVILVTGYLSSRLSIIRYCVAF